MDFNTIILKLIENNPNSFGTLMSVFFVPVGIVYLNNRHQKDLKKLEKELESKWKKDETKVNQQDLAYAALIKIHFDVQRLHTDLSLPLCNPDCIDSALDNFKTKLFIHQSEIANNQLRLSPKLIDIIYKYYRLISELEVELKKIKDNVVENALECVSNYSERLADTVIEYHTEVLMERDNEVPIELKTMNNFKSCCGGGKVL